MNIKEALESEIKRNEELLEVYKEIPTGTFGAAMIEIDLKTAKKALSEIDTVQMLKSYKDLKNNE